jgi:hypothetical protein
MVVLWDSILSGKEKDDTPQQTFCKGRHTFKGEGLQSLTSVIWVLQRVEVFKHNTEPRVP